MVIPNVSVVKNIPVVKNIHVVKNIPVVKVMPVVNNVPVIKNIPVVNNIPGIKNIPVVKSEWKNKSTGFVGRANFDVKPLVTPNHLTTPSSKPSSKTSRMLSSASGALSTASAALAPAIKMKNDMWYASKKVNPVSYMQDGVNILKSACYSATFNKGGLTRLSSIICFSLTILSWILWVVSNLITLFVFSLFFIFTNLIKLMIFITPFLPILFVLFVIGLVSKEVWDNVIVYIIKGFIEVYNGIVNAWNGLTHILNNLGINFRILGNRIHIPLLNLNLPEGDTISAYVPGFWEFLNEIIQISIIRPLEKHFNHYIYRRPSDRTTSVDLKSMEN